MVGRWLVAATLAAGLAGCAPPEVPTPEAEADVPCSPVASDLIYRAAQRERVIRGAAVRPDGVLVLVDPVRWRRLSLAGQQRLAAAVDCGVSRGQGHLVALRFRVDQDGPDLWALDAVELLKLRRAVAATDAGSTP